MVNVLVPPQGGRVVGSGHGTVTSVRRLPWSWRRPSTTAHSGWRCLERERSARRTTAYGPGLPPEPEPQVRAATVGYVAAPEPLLTAPLLADTAADAVDSRTAKFLLRDALKKLEEEENWEERRMANAHLKAMTELVRRVPGKRKQRRKNKLSRGRARRRQRQRPLSGALIVDSGRGMCRAGFSSSRCVPFGCRQAQMLGIMAGMTRGTRTPLVSGSHLFAVLLVSTVDTCYVSLQRLLWLELFVFSAMLGSTVALGDDFLELFEFSAMLGSTVALGDDFLELFEFSAMLGSTVALGDDFSY